jgi:hypothetical protein
MRGASFDSSAVHHASRGASVSTGQGSTPTAAVPALTSAITCAGVRSAWSGVNAPKCSRAAWV